MILILPIPINRIDNTVLILILDELKYKCIIIDNPIDIIYFFIFL